MTRFDRLFAIMTKPSVVVLYIAFIIFSFLYLDQPIAYYFHQVDVRANFPLINWLTKLGLGGLYLIALLLFVLFFRYIRPNKQAEVQAWFVWLCVLLPSLICLVLKILLGRARPDLLFSEQLYGFYGLQKHAPFWSFPSGHTTNIMGLIFGLCVLFPRYCYALLAVGLLIASTRIFLTHHYLSDVLAASYLALIEVGLLRWWLERQNVRVNSPDEALNGA